MHTLNLMVELRMLANLISQLIFLSDMALCTVFDDFCYRVTAVECCQNYWPIKSLKYDNIS